MYTVVLSKTGGAQHTMSLLGRELVKRGHKITFFTRPPYDSEQRYVRWLSEVGIPVQVLHRFQEMRAIESGIKMMAFLLTLPYALLNLCSLSESSTASRSILRTVVARLESRYVRSQFTEALKKARGEGREVILHIWGPALLTPLLLEWAEDHGVPSIYHEMGEADTEYIKTWHLEETVQSINRARLAIAVSPSVAEKIRQVFGYRGKILAIHDLIIEPEEVCVNGKNDGGRIAFGAIGRLVPHKRHTEILHALKGLCDEGHDVALVIASDGPMRKPLEELSIQLGIRERVTFLGEFERLEEVMAQFDVFVLTSSSESQCMPVTESMAYGKPVVVSDFGGIPDFVQDGVTGFLIPVGEPSRLLEAMRKLAVDPALRKAMGTRGRERFVDLYRPQKAVDLVEQAYSSLLAGT